MRPAGEEGNSGSGETGGTEGDGGNDAAGGTEGNSGNDAAGGTEGDSGSGEAGGTEDSGKSKASEKTTRIRYPFPKEKMLPEVRALPAEQCPGGDSSAGKFC